ncbi:MAG TPA: ComF family protein [Candidatus Acidoferrum sp.]|nr:ComF family protein [Candidatus Acidoferrum sp.]
MWNSRLRWLSAARDALTSVLLGGDCRICKRVLLHSSRVPLCQECLESFALMPGEVCAKCGLPRETWSVESAGQTEEEARCPACRAEMFAFDRARSFAVYENAVVRAILLLKFERIEPLGWWFARRLAQIVAEQGESFAADVVVPVPLHRDRERERGYNQAEMLSKPLAKILGLPHRGVLLMRTKPRPNKHILTLEERWEAVRGAFATRPGSQVDNQRVLLVDDVMTTGATLDACAKALREAGAKAVLGLTVARAVRTPQPVAKES